MTRIGLLSDTHGFLDEDILQFFQETNEVWHAGDIGGIEVADRLKAIRPLRAVYGNIDDHRVRTEFPEIQIFTVEHLTVFITHIGGYPRHYERGVREKLLAVKPGLFISGHSHILKVMPDRKLDLLHINPGAAGKSGFHTLQTAVRFIIEEGKVKELDVYQKPRR